MQSENTQDTGYRKLTAEQLTEILEAHERWLGFEGEGRQADLRCVDLSEVHLPHAELSHANLEEARLAGANLSCARLTGANLKRADLRGADLQCAYLSGALLLQANLKYANLEGADIDHANLKGANMSGAKLDGAVLDDAQLAWATMEDGEIMIAERVKPPSDLEPLLFQLGGRAQTGAPYRAADHEDAQTVRPPGPVKGRTGIGR